MNKEIEIGDIQLWNSTIEDLKEQARHAKTLKARIRLAKSLNMARGYLKHAESKILVCLVLAILFCSGCQTASGLGRDITSVSDGFMEQNAKNR